jgi:hypothetical protein
MKHAIQFCCSCALLLFVAGKAAASERHFAFTYETSVLAEGDAELEPWTTVRVGRERYYSRIDNRLEFELGLFPNLQTALYWNFSRTTEDIEDPISGELSRVSTTSFNSISSEWKYNLSNPVADALGSALYLEGTYGPALVEVEGKLLLDKQLGDVLIALNLVAEKEWELVRPDTIEKLIFEADLGLGYFFTPSFVGGVEVVSETFVESDEVTSSALYAGPSIAYADSHYWLSFAVTPQVFAPKSQSGDTTDLARGEAVRGRVLLGFHL